MIRPGSRHDARFLRDMLHHAYYWREHAPQDPMEGSVQRYVMSWGRPGDAAVIAYDDAGNVGAAWYRLFKEREPGYGFVDEQTPSVEPDNPALRLYERHGFRKVGESGGSWTMLARLNDRPD